MQKKQQESGFDKLVGELIAKFASIPNFDLLSAGEPAKKAFNILSFRIADIGSYKQLQCNHVFPATNKAIFNAKADFEQSRYRHILHAKGLDFNETLYDTVRLAYVGLFHKIENFINDLASIPNLIFWDGTEAGETVYQYAKRYFNFDFRDWRRIYIVNKINWVCNCVKHKDSYPLKEPRPSSFTHLDSTQRIRLTPQQFKSDCELLMAFYQVYIQLAIIFGQHKYLILQCCDTVGQGDFPSLDAEISALREKMDEKIFQMINAITE